jgi:glycosyltransferase involved in cell wall biosynthesis
VTPAILDKFAESDERITVYHKANENRAIAYNFGMDHATGEWICWLDSDDEYISGYLRQLDKAIREFPEYDIFNFRAIYQYPDHNTLISDTFRPAEIGEGHEWFRAGHIINGTFVFRRSLWKDNQEKYRMPDEANPFQFAAHSKIPMKFDPIADKWFYENCPDPDTCFQDGVYRQGVSLGNPWGQDYAEFYLLTRDNHSKSLDCALYITYPRTSEDEYTDFGEIYDTGVVS